MSESLEQLISSAGWHPRPFASAEEFVSYSCSLGPSWLVAEVMLPGLSGLSLQQQVLLDRADIQSQAGLNVYQDRPHAPSFAFSLERPYIAQLVQFGCPAVDVQQPGRFAQEVLGEIVISVQE